MRTVDNTSPLGGGREGTVKFSSDMQMLSEIIGTELTMKVIAHLSGISLYIPKPDYNVIRFYHAQMGGNVKRTAQRLGVSERMVYRAIQTDSNDGQLSIYDELARMELQNQ